MHPYAQATLGILMVSVLSACYLDDETRELDSTVVVTVDQLQAFGIEVEPPIDQFETFEHESELDGTVSISYEYARPDGVPPYVMSLSSIHSYGLEACLNYYAFGLGTAFGGLTTRARNDYSYGWRSEFASIMNDSSTPVGTYFAMCDARRFHATLIVGLHFPDPEAWQEAIEPTLERLRNFGKEDDGAGPVASP